MSSAAALVTVSLNGEVLRLALSGTDSRVDRQVVLARLLVAARRHRAGARRRLPERRSGSPSTAGKALRAARSPCSSQDPAPARLDAPPADGAARQEVSFVEAGGTLYLAGGGTRHQRYDPADAHMEGRRAAT